MRSRNIFMIVALWAIAGSANAQTGTIKGTITTSDGKPAQFVNIRLRGIEKGRCPITKGNTLSKKPP